MATGIIRNFLIPAPPSPYLPLLFQQCPYSQDQEKMQEEHPEVREGEEYEEEEEDCDIQEEEEEEEGIKEAFFPPGPHDLDVTKQLLRFADLISRDVQRYFGRSSSDEACSIYNDPIAITTSGRLRYYDDLLKIARAGSPEEPENAASRGEGQGGSGLGPLAELFQLVGPSQAYNRPMAKRHLPLSFWSEPSPRCSTAASGCSPQTTNTHSGTTSEDGEPTGRIHPQLCTNCLGSSQPDFSDLLAFWEPNPELTHTLTDNTHMH